MPKQKKKDTRIEVLMTNTQKNQIKNLADVNKKSMSEYLLDAGLSLTLDTAKMNFYQKINDDLLFLKKHNIILTRLVMSILNTSQKDKAKVTDYYKRIEQEAENILKGEDE